MITAPETAPPVAGPPRRRRPSPGVVVMALAAVAFLAYALPPYVGLDPAASRVPPPAGLPHFYPMLVAHIAFGTIALLTSVLQVWPWLRRTHPVWHRVSGRLYLFAGTLPAAVAVLTIAPFGESGPAQQAGNTVLGVLWLVTGIAGYRAARARRFAEHRLWMLRSVALTWSIVANRVWLLIAFAIFAPGVYTGGEVDPAQLAQAAGVSTWVSWVVNLLIVEWWVNRPKAAVRSGQKPRSPRVSGAPGSSPSWRRSPSSIRPR